MKRREKSSKKKRLKKILGSYIMPNGTRKETQIEAIIRTLLENSGLKFQQEFPVKYGKRNKSKRYDFYVWEENDFGEKVAHLLVEAHGQFFHAIDLYNGSKSYSRLSAIQKKNVRNDFLKRKIAEKNHMPLIAFWEKDIHTNPRKILDKIISTLLWVKGSGAITVPEDIHPIYEYKVTRKDSEEKIVKRKKISVKKSV
jgi:G:T-mismatch repair DNA endonuclease (very short patch repair protein)